MSQVNQSTTTPTRPASAPVSSAGSSLCARPSLHTTLVTGAPPQQAKRDFDAALRRASTSQRDEDQPETEATAHKEEPRALPPLNAQGALSGNSALAGGEGMAGAAAQTPMQTPLQGNLPTAVPAALAQPLGGHQTGTTPTGTAIGQQWRMQVPLDSATNPATLALRLTQSGAGQWQLRVGTDNQTRQQLLPHMDRLRTRLRQHSQGRFDDLSFDDDTTV